MKHQGKVNSKQVEKEEMSYRNVRSVQEIFKQHYDQWKKHR